MTMLPVDLGTSPLMYGGGLSADQFQVPNLKPKGMFAGGGLQNALLAAAAGFMARRSPAMSQNLMAPLMEQRQQALAEAQNQRELQRQKDLYLFKLQNPEPINNDTANDYAFWQQHLTPEQFQEYVQNKISPPQYMNVPGVGLVQIPRGGAPATPTAPVGKLTPIGGPSPGGSGTFPY